MNGVWTNSGDPAAGTGASFTGRDFTNFTPLYSDNSSDVVYTANFGQRAYAYTPPSGFKSLNTYNLADPVITDPSSISIRYYMKVTQVYQMQSQE